MRSPGKEGKNSPWLSPSRIGRALSDSSAGQERRGDGRDRSPAGAWEVDDQPGARARQQLQWRPSIEEADIPDESAVESEDDARVLGHRCGPTANDIAFPRGQSSRRVASPRFCSRRDRGARPLARISGFGQSLGWERLALTRSPILRADQATRGIAR